MYRIRLNTCASVALVGTFFFSFSSSAMKLETSVGAGLEYTSNAALASDNEDDDLVVITSVGAKIDAGSGPFAFNADTSLRRENYTQNTFGDQNYLNLSATATWEMLKDRVDWTLQDFFSQQSIITFSADTPDNTQDTNILTFGPNIYFPISGRQSITLVPEYKKFTYDVQNVDNQQNSLNANWNYNIFRMASVGIRGSVSKVDYDEPVISDITFNNIGVTAYAKRARSDFSVDLGVTHASRDDGSSSDRGLSGNVIWVLNLTGYSNVRTYISSDLTNSSDRLLGAARNPENGDFSNQQITSEVLRNRVARVAYTETGTTQSVSAWVELLDQNYEQSLLDQEVQALEFTFDYSLTAVLKVGVSTRYERTNLTDVNRKDKEYSVRGNLNYRLSRKLRTIFSLRYQDKNSTLNTQDFNEYSVFIGLIYGYGTVAR